MNDMQVASVAVLTQGSIIPSTRFRIGQHAPALAEEHLDVTFLHAEFGAYPPPAATRRPTWLLSAFADSYSRVRRSNKFDICILQRELISTLCTFERSIKTPFLFDVDDAIFMNSRFGAADRLASAASLTICGNNFLAEHFSAFGPVEVLPTAVDTARFKPSSGVALSRPVIGWSGSSSGFKYLYSIEKALVRVLDINPDAVLMIISDSPPHFADVPTQRLVFKKWTAETEVSDMLHFTVGLMPLIDGLWERGKCSFKMLTYMAACIPVVVSPVGMNVEVLGRGPCGYSASTTNDWVGAILSVLEDESSSRAMGVTGREIVEEFYSSKVIGSRLARIIRSQL